MAFVRKTSENSSMFVRSFVLIAACVLFSLLNSGLLIMMFFGRFWEETRLNALSKDAIGLVQNIELIMTDFDELEDLKNKDATMFLASAILSLTKSVDCEMFLVDANGNILLCKDMIQISGASITIGDSCPAHTSQFFSHGLMAELAEDRDEPFEYDGIVERFGVDEFFLVGSSVKKEDRILCYVVLMQLKSEAIKPYTLEFASMLILSAVIALSLSFIAALGVSYRIVRPLKKISEATLHYAKGDFDIRISEKENYKEIKELVSSVNSMAESLALIEESRSNFVANISHELKTPMTIISGFVDGILDGTIPSDAADKYLNIISDEIKRLSRLVVSMLNMSKIEAGQLSVNFAEMELSSMIFKTMLSFEKVINERQINVIGLEYMDKTVIMADEGLINQIIYNLIDNAVKFTPSGENIILSLKNDKKNAVMTIRNTGKGIAASDRGLIFDRFYKVDKSRGLDSKSFGMGLYIVKRIVELHDGTIRINSEIDEYTEFVVTLPTGR